MRHLKQEEFRIILLNSNKRLIRHSILKFKKRENMSLISGKEIQFEGENRGKL